MHLLHAIRSLLAFHFALRLGAQLRILALPFTHRLGTHMATRLLVNATLHFACRLATLCLACCTVFRRTKMFGANNFTHRFPALHFAAICIETFATRGTRWLITYRPTLLIALWGVACPRAHRCTILGLALFLHTRAPLSPTTIAMEMSTMAFGSCLPHSRWGHWQVLFDFLLDLPSARLYFLSTFSEIASL
jgi:hypothetical protein